METAPQTSENSAVVKTKKGIRVPIYLSTEEYSRLKAQAEDSGFKAIAPYVRYCIFENQPYIKAVKHMKAFISEAIRL